jgi:hypothetical protein
MVLPIAAAVLLGSQAGSANAQQKPGDAELASIIEQLSSRHRAASSVEFVNVDPVPSPGCGMNAASMNVSHGSESRSFPVLVQRQRGKAVVRQIFARLGRLSVDADGAGRAYHADDPFGQQTCSPLPNQPSQQPCALDNFSDAGMRLFAGSTRLKHHPDSKSVAADEPEFLPNWRDFWPLIRDQKLVPLRLAAIVDREGPRDYNLIHWPERNLTFAFNTKIVPATTTGFPCRYGPESEYSGYFVSATTFTKRSHTSADGCTPQRYLDAEKIPFFVVPTGKFGGIELGDIVIGLLRTPEKLQIAYGIAGDTGPYDHFGEGSIAFNKALLGIDKPVESAREVDRLDINLAEPDQRHGDGASLAVLLLGGTKRLLGGDYSQANIQKVGQAQFKRWSAAGSGGEARLGACFDAAH